MVRRSALTTGLPVRNVQARAFIVVDLEDFHDLRILVGRSHEPQVSLAVGQQNPDC